LARRPVKEHSKRVPFAASPCDKLSHPASQAQPLTESVSARLAGLRIPRAGIRPRRTGTSFRQERRLAATFASARQPRFFFESTLEKLESTHFELEKSLFVDEKTPFQLVRPRIDLEKTRGVFVQPLFLFVSYPFRFEVWPDLEESPHFELELPLFLFEGSHFELETRGFVSAKWPQRARRSSGGGSRGCSRPKMDEI
jgi:hypothetical protein